jgi:hypothetical protein
MAEQIKYTCTCCGKEHFKFPALAFISPDNYNTLSPGSKKTTAKINSDFCIIYHPDQTDRFIRCVLTQRVIDHCENLEYGLWVSLSEKSFDDYAANFNNENHETSYFAWLCNDIPGYEFEESIPTTIFTRPGNQRPEIVPHDDYDHPFVKDYYHGISKAEAEKRIKIMLDSISG